MIYLFFRCEGFFPRPHPNSLCASRAPFPCCTLGLQNQQSPRCQAPSLGFLLLLTLWPTYNSLTPVPPRDIESASSFLRRNLARYETLMSWGIWRRVRGRGGEQHLPCIHIVSTCPSSLPLIRTKGKNMLRRVWGSQSVLSQEGLINSFSFFLSLLWIG